MSNKNFTEPLIIPRAEHPISRKDIDREALKVMYKLRDAGFSSWLVGGGVRDLYLGKKPKDFDISTDARPGQLRKLFRNSRIIGNRFRLVQVFFKGGKIIEVSTLRCRDEYELNGRDPVLASNNTFGSLPEDAFRRDLTINSLFYEIENFTVIDYVGGVKDLQDGVIRIVGDPERRVVRDPVRIMRAVRHAARNNFQIEEETWKAVTGHIDDLGLCPVSRIRDELFKDLHSGALENWAKLAFKCGLFIFLLPCYKNYMGTTGADRNQGDGFYPPVFEKLISIFRVIDRIHLTGYHFPDQLLLALILLPWAQEEMDLMADRPKKDLYELSQKIKKRLIDDFGHLNLKRAVKDGIATLLINLPVFLNHASKRRKWPAWIKKKSYFPDGLFFYKLYREATGGDRVAVVEPAAEVVEEKKPRKRLPRRVKRAAAFSKARGGVFGLRKK